MLHSLYLQPSEIDSGTSTHSGWKNSDRSALAAMFLKLTLIIQVPTNHMINQPQNIFYLKNKQTNKKAEQE